MSAGLWLLAAPTAQADFDDMLDTLFGVAGADPALVANLPDAPLDFRTSDADPLAQLEEVLRRAPADSDAPGDTTRPGDSPATDDSGDPPSLPKFNMPGAGSGGSGGSGGGGGGPSNPAPAHSKTKTNASAAKHSAPLPKETGAE
ncbi:hypothetical protein MHIB_39000 [Mycolicibacter hiberniae]|uniref:Uncharacterized protein n=2 Tax=Mycolicibacter hiberniae TaxID=29314 RepID=A0A7I7X7M9_9MYCO|nr:hypothetical protein AWC09_16230 [Mycolicibacter hiberniae]BBZ25482.1 hypothetical protein MHIB_39000 [Mycolicibacter hiberniae]